MNIFEKIKKLLKNLYLKLRGINDSPNKIAAGFAIGVFFGILPCAGPLAAVLFAALFRVNKAAAFIGGLITNTWLSLILFVFSLKVGSAVLGVSWQDIYEQTKDLFEHFHIKNFFDPTVLEILKPLWLGYLLVDIAIAPVIYFITLIILLKRKKRLDALKKHND